MMTATVPPGMAGGMMMQVQTATGPMQVQIPAGLGPGMSFQFGAPAVATAVAVQQVVVPVQQVVQTGGFKAGPNEWHSSGTYGCFSDIGSCCCVYWCCPCAICQIGEKLGNMPVGPKNEPANQFMNIGGMIANCLSYVNICTFVLACIVWPEKTCCNYDKNILESVATFKGKKVASPGPCSDTFCQMCCPLTQACTYCLLYRGQCNTRSPALVFPPSPIVPQRLPLFNVGDGGTLHASCCTAAAEPACYPAAPYAHAALSCCPHRRGDDLRQADGRAGAGDGALRR